MTYLIPTLVYQADNEAGLVGKCTTSDKKRKSVTYCTKSNEMVSNNASLELNVIQFITE